MKITKLELKNFKRFDDLTVDLTLLTKPAKLVLLIGANGSGKSSVFDAFEAINKLGKEGVYHLRSYYSKKDSSDYSVIVTTDKIEQLNHIKGEILFSSNHINKLAENVFYGRTSIRQIPRLTRTTLGQSKISFKEDSDRSTFFIDRDNRFENDIEKVASSILTDVFTGDSSTAQIKESYVNPINKSFEHIFGPEGNTQIKLISIKPPLEGKTAEILFQKGSSQIPYDYLSSGEKEIFNILLNLLTRTEYFQDTVYFLDEIDLHLNTQLQKNLLKEITENWIPESCQLWTASHSLGFIEYANEAEHAAIIDFDNLNFDLPQVIFPSPKKNFDIFEIAVSKKFLAQVFDGKRIIFSENTDTSIYNSLNFDNTIFFNAKDKVDVFYKAKNNPLYNGLIDRDYLTDDERERIQNVYTNLFILQYYSIESYLYHPENLAEFYHNKQEVFNKENYTNSIISEKSKIRDKILIGVLRARESYSFFREDKPKITRADETLILQMFDSTDFETFYKVFPAKDFVKQIPERQNLNKDDLAKTNWFKIKIQEVLTK